MRHFSVRDPLVKILVVAFLCVGILFVAVFAYFYFKYERVVDRRMAGGIFSNAAKIYARPRGDRRWREDGSQPSCLRAASRRLCRRKQRRRRRRRTLLSWPAAASKSFPDRSRFTPPTARLIRFSGGKIASITESGEAIAPGTLQAYELEPQLVTALFEGQDRTKRELIKFEDIPPVLVNAVLAIEDRRFFQHGGVNYFRLMEAAWSTCAKAATDKADRRSPCSSRAASSSRPEKTIKRKLTEMLIAIELEQKFSKQRIFQMYANQVYLGQRGSFTINGFGEAAHAYFNKDVKNLSLPEAALLAGMIQRPNYLSPYKYPKRALERRNLVLDSMVETGAITRDEADRSQGRAAEADRTERRGQRCAVLCRPGEGPAVAAVQRRRAEQPRVAHLHDHRSGPAARCRRSRR